MNSVRKTYFSYLKRLAFVIAVLAFLLKGSFFGFGASWGGPGDINAGTAIVMDADTGAILYGKNIHEKCYPASITKLMTALLVLENCSQDEMVTFSERAVTDLEYGAVTAYMSAGDQLSVKDCLYALLLYSANDVANALAEHVGGSIEGFAEMMNERARELGCADTSFKNPSGLPAPGQKTTARDMAKLARAYLRAYPSVRTFHATRRLVHRGRAINNTNQLLGRVRGVDGLKTGFTAASGYNVIITAERNGVRLMAVVMGGSSRAARDNMARRLVEAGFAAPGSPAKVKRLMAGRRR